MRNLILQEFRWSSAVELSAAETLVLRRLVPTVVAQPSESCPGRFDITPASQVGVVRIGDLQVNIKPKIGIARLLFLVSYALDPHAWLDESVALGEGDLLNEAVVPGFLRQLDRAFRRGLLHGYESRSEALMT